ncbi:MAG: glycerophosphodiester phosphodiesterase family protein, partial [Bacteroidota bacterium]
EGKIRGEEGADIWYNIETKTDPRGDNMFHPAPEPFVDALVSIIEEKGIAARAVIQSFDLRTLQVAHTKYPDIKLALLVGDTTAPAVYLDSLGFTPYIYSCRYTLLEKQDIVNLQRQGMKVIPWTVNQPADIQRLMGWGVDGIISDYPDRVIAVQKQKTGGS